MTITLPHMSLCLGTSTLRGRGEAFILGDVYQVLCAICIVFLLGVHKVMCGLGYLYPSGTAKVCIMTDVYSGVFTFL